MYFHLGILRWCEDIRIVHKNINVPPLLGQVPDKGLDLGGAAHVKLKGQDLDALADLLGNLRGKLLEGVDAAGREDKAQAILGRGAGEL